MPWLPALYLSKLEVAVKLAKAALADALAKPPASSPEPMVVQPAAILPDATLTALETDGLPSLIGTNNELVEKFGLLKRHRGTKRFTLERVAPHLRAELDRRILANASLIKLNREAAIDTTLRRFAGWSTSIPVGGTEARAKSETKINIKKALAQLPFVERRVAIDQGMKFISCLSDIVATDGGAIAAQWDSNWRQAGYNYRKNHKAHDGKVYLIRNSWAHTSGFVKAGDAGYVDQTEMPGQLPMCQCSYVYLYDLSDLPPDMLTKKGEAELAPKHK